MTDTLKEVQRNIVSWIWNIHISFFLVLWLISVLCAL
jgi:hypothetical protein